jgi:hypothetical protein
MLFSFQRHLQVRFEGIKSGVTDEIKDFPSALSVLNVIFFCSLLIRGNDRGDACFCFPHERLGSNSLLEQGRIHRRKGNWRSWSVSVSSGLVSAA